MLQRLNYETLHACVDTAGKAGGLLQLRHHPKTLEPKHDQAFMDHSVQLVPRGLL